MTRKKNWFMVLVLIMVLGILISENAAAQNNDRLNGTWISNYKELEMEMILNNGYYERSSIIDRGEFQTFEKGNYSINNGMISFKPTHCMQVGSFVSKTGLISGKLYAIDEYIISLKKSYKTLGMSEEMINENIKLIISQPPFDYSLISNSLILTLTYNGKSETMVYTKK